jgi:hypothetical protein
LGERQEGGVISPRLRSFWNGPTGQAPVTASTFAWQLLVMMIAQGADLESHPTRDLSDLVHKQRW